MTPYYDDGNGIVIYHGDCREIIPNLSTPDLVLTDPPYGINYATNHKVGGIGASWIGNTIANDSDTVARDAVLAMLPNVPAIVFGSWKVPHPEQTRMVLVWDKGPAFGMGDLSMPWKPSWEEIYVIGGGFAGHRDEGVIKGFTGISWESKGRKHPNEKPVKLLRYLLSKHPGIMILDPFMGSGTTIRAAKDLGRKAIGIEIEEKYCEVAAKRLQQSVLFLDIAA